MRAASSDFLGRARPPSAANYSSQPFLQQLALRLAPYSPMIFTNTRLRRWPSNSP